MTGIRCQILHGIPIASSRRPGIRATIVQSVCPRNRRELNPVYFPDLSLTNETEASDLLASQPSTDGPKIKQIGSKRGSINIWYPVLTLLGDCVKAYLNILVESRRNSEMEQSDG